MKSVEPVIFSAKAGFFLIRATISPILETIDASLNRLPVAAVPYPWKFSCARNERLSLFSIRTTGKLA